jgi:hypothetical protein
MLPPYAVVEFKLRMRSSVDLVETRRSAPRLLTAWTSPARADGDRVRQIRAMIRKETTDESGEMYQVETQGWILRGYVDLKFNRTKNLEPSIHRLAALARKLDWHAACGVKR